MIDLRNGYEVPTCGETTEGERDPHKCDLTLKSSAFTFKEI